MTSRERAGNDGMRRRISGPPGAPAYAVMTILLAVGAAVGLAQYTAGMRSRPAPAATALTHALQRAEARLLAAEDEYAARTWRAELAASALPPQGTPKPTPEQKTAIAAYQEARRAQERAREFLEQAKRTAIMRRAESPAPPPPLSPDQEVAAILTMRQEASRYADGR